MSNTISNEPNYQPWRNQLQYDYQLLRNKPTQECYAYRSVNQTFWAVWTQIQFDQFDNLSMKSWYNIKILKTWVYVVNASLWLRPWWTDFAVAVWLNWNNFVLNNYNQITANITRVNIWCCRIAKLNKWDLLGLYWYDSAWWTDYWPDKCFLEVYQIR